MTLHERATTWFLAQLKPNCGHIADRNLKQQGFSTFLPLEEQTKRLRSKFITRLAPLFPGYLFVAFDPAIGQHRAINSTYGVTRLVSFGKEPAPVPRAIVDQLMRRCDVSGKLLPPTLLQPGNQVRVTAGPFANFLAEIETLAPDRRVWVLMNLMGGPTRVAVSADQLQLAS